MKRKRNGLVSTECECIKFGSSCRFEIKIKILEYHRALIIQVKALDHHPLPLLRLSLSKTKHAIREPTEPNFAPSAPKPPPETPVHPPSCTPPFLPYLLSMSER